MSKKHLFLPFILFLSACAIPSEIYTERYLENINKKDISYERFVFEKFINDLKPIIKKHYSKNKMPSIFISYSWEDLETKEGSEKNKENQERLSEIYDDFKKIGIETFLDIRSLSGDIRHGIKSSLNESDFVFIIGTPRLKERSISDRLFYLPYFDPRLIPSVGNVISIVKEPNFFAIYYMENGELKDIITLILDISKVKWTEKENGIREAEIGSSTNDLLEELFLKIPSRKNKLVTNIQFELGLSIDKHRKTSKTIVPLLISGTINESFPLIIQGSLIREIKTNYSYYCQMAALSNPLGIIATIFPELLKDHEYIEIVEKFEKSINLSRGTIRNRRR